MLLEASMGKEGMIPMQILIIQVGGTIQISVMQGDSNIQVTSKETKLKLHLRTPMHLLKRL